MPELPEVEIIRRGLERKIVGKTIKSIEILNPKSFLGKVSDVEGKTVERVWRRAKMLGIELDNIILLIHLKMSGQLIWEKDKEKIIGGHPTKDMDQDILNRSTRVIFEFSDNSHLYFNDQRKFGWIRVETGDKILGNLGPEPLEKDFTWEILKTNLLKHPKVPIKLALMDQTIVSGVGNIYANESLYLAKIDPRRKVGDLTGQEIKKITEGIKQSLETAISYGGSTRQHFKDVESKAGDFLSYAKVYGKEGQKCPDCQGVIKKIKLGGRGTYFCESCQR